MQSHAAHAKFEVLQVSCQMLVEYVKRGLYLGHVSKMSVGGFMFSSEGMLDGRPDNVDERGVGAGDYICELQGSQAMLCEIGQYALISRGEL